MSFALAMCIALAIDWSVGWPDALTRRVGHPVIWIGALITRLERLWNHAELDPGARRRAGTTAALIVVFTALVAAAALQTLLPNGFLGTALLGVLAWPLVAAQSLRTHVAAIALPLVDRDIDRAREAVSNIVGRDPKALDEGGIARAAIESLAENTSDGVTAPLFWGAIFGLPGIAGYKAINTLDSMIGYRSARHRDFGRFAARLDDVVNWLPARATGALYSLISDNRLAAFDTMKRDARRHRSPNAGWPEAAMAGALGVRLSGPRTYQDGQTSDPWLNGAAPDPTGRDVTRALDLFHRIVIATGVLLIIGAVL